MSSLSRPPLVLTTSMARSALFRDELGTPWSEIGAERDPKEAYALPFLERRGWGAEVGGGRKRAMRAMAGQVTGLLSVCPEVGDLAQSIGARLTGGD